MIDIKRLFAGILFIICIGCLLSACNNNENRIKYSDDINYYIDTINGHVILTTVLYNKNYSNISISSIELKD